MERIIIYTFFKDALLDDSNDSGVLSSVPSALARWTEEARVLDAESMHDCLTGKFQLRTPIIW